MANLPLNIEYVFDCCAVMRARTSEESKHNGALINLKMLLIINAISTTTTPTPTYQRIKCDPLFGLVVILICVRQIHLLFDVHHFAQYVLIIEIILHLLLLFEIK